MANYSDIVRTKKDTLNSPTIVKYFSIVAAINVENLAVRARTDNFDSARHMASIAASFNLLPGKQSVVTTIKDGKETSRTVTNKYKDPAVSTIKLKKPPTKRAPAKTVGTKKAPAKKKVEPQIVREFEKNGKVYIEEMVAPTSAYGLNADIKYLYGYLLIRFGKDVASVKAEEIASVNPVCASIVRIAETIADSAIDGIEHFQVDPNVKPKLSSEFGAAYGGLMTLTRSEIQLLGSTIDINQKDSIFRRFFARICIAMMVGRTMSKQSTGLYIHHFFEKWLAFSLEAEVIGVFKDFKECWDEVIVKCEIKTAPKKSTKSANTLSLTNEDHSNAVVAGEEEVDSLSMGGEEDELTLNDI